MSWCLWHVTQCANYLETPPGQPDGHGIGIQLHQHLGSAPTNRAPGPGNTIGLLWLVVVDGNAGLVVLGWIFATAPDEPLWSRWGFHQVVTLLIGGDSATKHWWRWQWPLLSQAADDRGGSPVLLFDRISNLEIS